MINKIMIKLWKTVSLIKGGADVFCQMLIFKLKDSCANFEVIISPITGVISLFSSFCL